MGTRADNYITGDPAFAVDRQGVIVLWNSAAEHSLNHPAAEALGQKCWELLSGKDANGNRYCCQHCPLIEMAIRHEPVSNFHSSFKISPDQRQPFAVSCLTVRDESDNEMLMHICHIEDSPMKVRDKTTPVRVTPVSHPGALSQREIEVLELLADKVKTKDIATRMSISIRTVRTHIQHLLTKMQVHKRKEAVELGKRLRLI